MSTVQHLPPSFVNRFKPKKQMTKQDKASYYKGLFEDIKKSQHNSSKTAKEAFETYDSHDSVHINVWHSIADYRMAASYPAPPKPAVEHIPSFNPDQDKVMRAVADMIKAVMAEEMDGETFENSIKEAIKQGVIGGRGLMGVELYIDPRTQMESLRFKAYPWNKVFIQPAATWEEVRIIMILQSVRKSDINPMLEKEYQDTLRQKMDAPTVSQNQGNKISKTDDDNLYIDEDDKEKYWHFLKIYDKNDGTINTLWLENGELIDSQPNPIRLPGFFPFAQPVQPIRMADEYLPIPSYAIIQEDQKELNHIAQQKHVILDTVAPKYLSFIGGDEVTSWITSSNPEYILANNTIKEVMQDFGSNANNMLIPYPIQEAVLTIAELTKEEMIIRDRMNDISGVVDLMRGQTDGREGVETQQLKAIYGNVRMQPLQQNVQWMCRELMQIMFDIIISNYSLTTIEAKANRQLNVGPRDEQGNPIPLNMLPEDQMQQIDPNDLKIYNVLRNDAQTSYRIDVDSASMDYIDTEKEILKQREMVATMKTFTEMTAGMTDNPEHMLFYTNMLQHSLDALRLDPGMSRDVDGLLNSQMEQFKEEIKNREDPEYLNQQKQAALEEAKMFDVDMIKADTERQTAQAKVEEVKLNIQLKQVELQVAQQVAHNEAVKAERELQLKEQENAFKQIQQEDKQAIEKGKLIVAQDAQQQKEEHDKKILEQGERKLDIEEKGTMSEIKVEQASIKQGNPKKSEVDE